MHASPTGGSGPRIDSGLHAGGGPPGNLPVVTKPPERRGDRLYWTPACPIVAQTFNNAADVNGATSDPSSTGWYLNATNVPNAAYFSIKSHRIKAQTLGGVGVWYSQPFSIAGYTNVQIDAKISSEGTFTSSEYMKVGYILDGKETDFETVTGSFGNDSTPTVTSGYLSGNTVQIVVYIYNVTAGNSDYYIEQYDVFKEVGPCTVSTSIPVTASASNSGVLTCTNPSTTLTASTTASGTTTYSWTGPSGYTATGASVTATTAGTYTVTGTNSAGTGTASVVVTSNTTAPAGLTATASGILTCTTTGVTLTGSSTTSGVTFAWTGPNSYSNTGASVTANMAGTYTLTATNPSTGCTASTTVAVTSNTTAPENITPTVSGPLTCSATSVTLSGTSSLSNATYTWAGPNSFSASGATATASTAGTYTLTATNPTTGCWGSTSIAVTSNTTPPAGVTATASGSLSCSTTSVTLTGSSTTSGATFRWSGPSGFTATGATATATAAGTYTLTATNPATGCTATASVTVTGTTTPPAGVAIATSNNVTQLTCTTNFITVLGSSTTSGATYSWSGPNNFNVASAAANVFNPGTYTLTVTNPADGCTSTANVVITQNATPPAAVAITPNLVALTCSNPSGTLTGSSSTAGVSYAWSGPNSFAATGTTATVISAGEYILTVTDPTNGCTSTTAAAISTNFTPPANVIAINNGPQTCSNVAVLLTGSSTTSGTTFAWTGPNGFTATGATTNLTSLGQDGTYTLTATNPANGCSAITTTVVAEDTATPAVLTIGSSTGNAILTCSNSNITLTASSSTSGVNYGWSGPNSFTGSSASVSVTNPGTYIVTATNSSNGCTSRTSTTITQNVTPPSGLLLTSNPSAEVLTCTTSSIAFNANASGSRVGYAWTGPGGFTFNGQTTDLSVPGTYSVTATDSTNGCSSTASAVVTQDITPPSAVTIGSATGTTIINCTNPTLTLTAGSTPNTATYSWSGPNSYSSATASTAVTVPGTYTVTATLAENGCSKTANVVIAIDTATPTAVSTSSVPANATLTCTAPNVVLTGTSGTPGVDYLWTGPSGFSIANAVATATTPGSYVLTVTNPGNGCSTAVTATAVTQNVVIPVGVTANVANKITCTTTTTTITGNSTTSGAAFAWTGPDGFTSSARVATASLGGVYTLTATNPSDGCTATKTVTVVADTATPTGVTATNSGELNCTVTTVTLTGNSTTSGATYIWTGPDGYFDPEQISSMASDSGTYVLTVTNPENGCSTEASTYVAMDLSACTAIKSQVTAGKGSGFDDSTLAGFTYKVYPNPVSGTTVSIAFEAPVTAQVIVAIYNNTGVPERVLFSNSVEANQPYRLSLNPGGLGTGIHYCVIRVNGKVYTTKLLVMPN